MNLTLLPEKRPGLTYVLLALVTLVVLWPVTNWTFSKIDAASREAAARTESAVRLERRATRVERAIADPGWDDRVRAADAALPDEVGLESLIDALSALARVHGVEWTAGTPARVGAHEGVDVEVWTLNLTLEGTADAVIAFVGGLGSLARLVVVDSVTITTGELTRSTASVGTRFFVAGATEPDGTGPEAVPAPAGAEEGLS